MQTASRNRPTTKRAGSKARDAVPTALAEGLLTPDEVARILHISRSMVYWLFRRGDLPNVRVNRLYRVRVADVRRYIDRHSTP